MHFEDFTEPKTENKQKNQLQLLIFIFLAGAGYYFFMFLPEKRNEVKEEIETAFQDDSINADSLNSEIWKGSKNWEEYLNKLCYQMRRNVWILLKIER